MKVAFKVVAITACLILAGCQAEEVPSKEGWGRVLLWTDAETGCQYLRSVGYHEHSITPRLRADGRPMCGGVQ